LTPTRQPAPLAPGLGYAARVDLDRDDIVREDFPKVRRGYDPNAVRAHLRSVADAVRERGSTPLAETAAERVGSIVEAAEQKATEIEAEARGEAERIVSAARTEAKEQVDRAQGAVSRLVEQADELRSAVGRLGSEITSQARTNAETPAPEVVPDRPEIVPEPARVPEPTPPRQPEPQPPLTPEPQPPPAPDPGPATVPEPQPPGPEVREGSPSTEDLLAQLRGSSASETSPPAANGDEAQEPEGGEADLAAARLVAMKMALEGASREEIGRHLDDNYSLAHRDKLLDDVLARAKP
jgi:DivIVA domain-containing protein